MRYSLFTILLFILLLSEFATGQGLSHEWHSIAFSNIDTRQILTSNPSSVLVHGTFSGNITFDTPFGDTTLYSHQHASNSTYTSYFIAKFSNQGHLLWFAPLECKNSSVPSSPTRVAYDGYYNIHLVGEIADSMDFNPSSMGYDYSIDTQNGFYLWCLNSSGQQQYNRQWQSSGIVYIKDLEVSNYGNAFINLNLLDTVDLDIPTGLRAIPPSICDQSDRYEIVFEVDHSGQVDWVKSYFPNRAFSPGDKLMLDEQRSRLFHFGEVYQGGTMPNGDTLTGSPFARSFLSIYDMYSGSTVNHTFAQDHVINGIDIDSEGSLLITWKLSSTYSNLHIDQSGPAFTPRQLPSYHLTKYDSTLSLTWNIELNSPITNVAADIGNNIYFGTHFNQIDGQRLNSDKDSLDFASTPTNGNNPLLYKVDMHGKVLWYHEITSPQGSAFVSEVKINGSNRVNAWGHFTNRIQFDSIVGDSARMPTQHAFLANFSQCQDSYEGWDTIRTCGPITWADNITYTSSTAKPTYRSLTSNGCDSLVHLFLEINPMNLQVSVNADSLYAYEDSANYQWFNCVNNAIISGANQQWFRPTENGYYAVILSNAYCTDTSVCQLVTGIGISESDQQDILIYPNPSSGSIQIEGAPNQAEIRIYTINGECISRFTCTEDMQIELPKIPGVYTLAIQNKEEITYHKVVVN